MIKKIRPKHNLNKKNIENIDAKIRFNSFDSNNEINVPEEMEKNAVISVDTEMIQNIFNNNTNVSTETTN